MGLELKIFIWSILNNVILFYLVISNNNMAKDIKDCIDRLKWIENYLLEDRRIKLKELKKNASNSSGVC